MLRNTEPVNSWIHTSILRSCCCDPKSQPATPRDKGHQQEISEAKTLAPSTQKRLHRLIQIQKTDQPSQYIKIRE